jgi:uncharacterized membrane protein HdeD (DUF308 family)
MITDTDAMRISRSSMVLSTALIVLGLLAMLLPVIPSVAVVLILGWLVLFNGIVQLAHAIQSKGIGHIAWKLLIAACFLVTGSILVLRPLVGLAGLTLTAAAFFFALGVVDIVSYFSTRRSGASGWMLVDGVVTLVLGLMIWKRWPANSLWFVGFLVGVGMLMTGITRLMMTLAARKLLRQSDNPLHERWAA